MLIGTYSIDHSAIQKMLIKSQNQKKSKAINPPVTGKAKQ